jgi:hypothetical protein
MPRIIVTIDPIDQRRAPVIANETPVLLDERVESVHLCDDHAAEQLIERLAWAVTDAEDAERDSDRPLAARDSERPTAAIASGRAA